MRNSVRSASQYAFSLVPSAEIPRCRLRRPSTHKTTINTDYLYPLFWDEVLPGDTFKLDVSMVAKFTTLNVPIMDNLWCDWQFFFIPYRLLWENFERMHGAQDNPDDSIDYTVPYVSAPSGGIAQGTIGDYFGLPLGVEWDDHDVMALPFRAYNLVWNEWYRDENLQNSVTVNTGDTAEALSSYSLLKRGKRKDYFTSALPAPQKGPAVTIPLASQAPVVGNGMVMGLTAGGNPEVLYGLRENSIGTSYTTIGFTGAYGGDVGTSYTSGSGSGGTKGLGLTKDPDKSGLVADLSAVPGSSINAIRQAFQLQRLLERDARGGTRYFELLRSHFGVTSPDSRLQRPEFLGSFTVPVNVNTVTQTSASVSGGTPQGNLSAFATMNSVNRAFTKSFVEYGMVLGLCSLRADLSYQQGIPRPWSRSSRFDFYYPALAHLGEQAVLNKEIYAQNASVVDANGVKVNDKAFGYQERWSEYKYGYNRISGDLRSTATASLDVWHLAQDFSSLPTLNADFIQESVPIDRVLAVSTANAPAVVLDVLFDLTCARPMPLYDVPGLIDHF